MEAGKHFNFEEKYKELIQYISQLGGGNIIYNDFLSVTIRVQDNSSKEFLRVNINVPKFEGTNNYDYSSVEVKWRTTLHTYPFKTHRFSASMDQKVIFNILLFEIINWKLDNIDSLISSTINKALSSEALTTWLNNKEQQIRADERLAISTHLSSKELARKIKDEINKIRVSLKIENK